MRINTNVSAINAQRNLFETNRSVDDSMRKLSSGLRIVKAGDDASGLVIANRLRANTRSLGQAVKNAEQANARLSIAEGSAQTIQKILERQRELVTQAKSANYNGSEGSRKALDDEFSALSAEVTRIIATTTYEGGPIFGATAQTYQVSASDTAADNLSFTINLAGAAITDTLFADVSANAGPQVDFEDVDAALDAVNETLATIGAAQNRLEFTVSNLKVAVQNQEAAESTIRDLDMAEEMTRFTKNTILQQAGTAMLAQANQSAQGILQLLR